MRRMIMVALLCTTFDTAVAQTPPICSDSSSTCTFLKDKYALGLAAGNSGDYYQNADNLHASLGLSPYHPQVTALTPLYGAVWNTYPDKVVVGNSSTAYTSEPGSVSQTRYNFMNQNGADSAYRQYRDNDMFWYPEHTDHDVTDDYHGMTPAVTNSQGSSGSEIDELRKIFYILAAFRPDTKQVLKDNGQLIPAIQMIMRRTRVASDAEYVSGRAHLNAYDNYDNTFAMVQFANSIVSSEAPPLALVRMRDDDYSDQAGRDYFDYFSNQRMYSVPVSICRIWRGFGYHKTMRVTAVDSFDANGRVLAYHWVILRGDPSHVTITPLAPDASEVRIDLDYHAEAVIPDQATRRTSNLVIIGCFVHNGIYYSAPAFVTSYTLPSERRNYDSASHRLLEAAYEDRLPYRMVNLDKNWNRDIFHYDTDGNLQGWTRHQGTKVDQFTREGYLVLAKDASGNVTQVQEVVYSNTASGTPKMTWNASGSAFSYAGEAVLPQAPSPYLAIDTPVIHPMGGYYDREPITAVLSVLPDSATITYTMDATTPYAMSPEYVGPVSISGGRKTVKAKAYAWGYADSAVTTTEFVTTPANTVAQPRFFPTSGSYNYSIRLVMECVTAGSEIRYTLDGTAPTATSTLYAAPIEISATVTVKAQGFKTGLTASAITTSTFTINASAVDTTPPSVAISKPAAEAHVSGITLFAASASDNSGGGVAWVEYWLDGNRVCREQYGYPYPVSFDTTTIAGGAHSLEAVAYDVAGNSKRSSAVTFYVDGAAQIIYGDVSENGTVSAYDASLTALYVAGAITLTPGQITKAEVSGNGTVSAYDASLIGQYAAGLIDRFPIQG